jgi:hypothetical protein
VTPPAAVLYESTAYPTTHFRQPAMTPQRNAWLALVTTFTKGFALTAIVTIVLGLTGHLWTLNSFGLAEYMVIAGWTGTVAGKALKWADTIRTSTTRAAAHATRNRPPL